MNLLLASDYKVRDNSHQRCTTFLAFTWPTINDPFPVAHEDGSTRILAFAPRCFEKEQTPFNIPIDYSHGMGIDDIYANIWHTDDYLMGMIRFPSAGIATPFLSAVARGEFNAISPTHIATKTRGVVAEDGSGHTLVEAACITDIALVKASANEHPNTRLWSQSVFWNETQDGLGNDLWPVWNTYRDAYFADEVRAANNLIVANQRF